MKKIILMILIFTVSCATINKLSHFPEDINGWWYLNPNYLTCSDTAIDQYHKPANIEEDFNILEGGCTRQLNDQKNILLLTCYAMGRKLEYAYFRTEEACNKYASQFRQSN